MKFRIQELKNTVVSAKSPLIALRKAIRKVVSVMELKGKDIFEMVNQSITLVNEYGEEQTYLVSIVPYDGKQKSIYYKLNYEIEVYKKLNNL